MKTTISIFRKSKVTYSLWLCLIFTFAVAVIQLGCKDESTATPKDEKSIVSRGGDSDSLSTEDLIELLGASCIPDSIDSLCTGPFYDTLNISLAGYTGCTFTVVYQYYSCYPSASHLDYLLGDFQILSHNCMAFANDLYNAYTAGGSTLASFVENFEHDIAEQIEDHWLDIFVPHGEFPCSEGHFFNLQYIRASCYKRCIIALPNNTETFVKIACGSDCCVKGRSACRDENGNLIINTYYYHPQSPSCTNPTIFDENPIVRRCERFTPCTYTCPE